MTETKTSLEISMRSYKGSGLCSIVYFNNRAPPPLIYSYTESFSLQESILFALRKREANFAFILLFHKGHGFRKRQLTWTQFECRLLGQGFTALDL